MLLRAPRVALITLVLGAALGCTQTPELVLDHLKRGDAALAEGRYGAALAAYGHARELAPTDGNVQKAMMRARVHLVAAQPSRLNAEAMEDARYEAELLLDADRPRAAVYLTALGNVLGRSGDVEGAKAKLAEALKADPASALAHTALGLVLMARKEGQAQAKAELEAALRTKPDHAPALLALGELRLGDGDAAGAGTLLETALRGGEDFRARMMLGTARVQQQKLNEAAEQFERAAQLEPKSPEAVGSLGQALLDAGKPEQAERALRVAVQLRPDEPSEIALGFALQRQKKLAEALEVLGRVLARDPGAATALFGAGLASEDGGQTDQAASYYRRVLAVPPEGPQKQMVLGLHEDARRRLSALTAPAPSGSASASPAGVARGGAGGPPGSASPEVTRTR